MRHAAEQTNRFADSLRDKKAEELLGSAVTWSRQQPLLTLAGAAFLGFALSRVVKTGVTAAEGSSANGGGSDAAGRADERRADES